MLILLSTGYREKGMNTKKNPYTYMKFQNIFLKSAFMDKANNRIRYKRGDPLICNIDLKSYSK